MRLANVLMKQQEFEEAETLLRLAHDQWQGKRPQDQHAVVTRTVELYDAWGKPDEAAKWRAKLPTTAPTTSEAASESDPDATQ
jgi:hypothetical protein